MTSSSSFPRVAVVGAGAVGGYFGGMLARAGAQVTLIGRPMHVDVWTREGLFIDSAKFRETIHVEASTDMAAARDAELVLFCVKGTDTDAAARELASYVREQAIVISLQNGVDNVTRMRAATQRSEAEAGAGSGAESGSGSGLDPIASVVYVAAAMPEAGRVKHNSRGDLVIGDLPGRSGEAATRDDVLARVAAWFEAAGVPCTVSPNVEADLWTKLIVNASLNPVSALANIPYAETVTLPESRDMVRNLVLECVAVARAGNVALPDQDYVEMIWAFAGRLATAYASTAQDLARGKRTEVDSLNGFILRRGQELGVPTPVNQAMLALIKLRERLLVT
jgi:2-dehydropantoate 2-reductase